MATRRERVILEIEDKFTAGILRGAAAVKVLDHELDSLADSAVRSTRTLDDSSRSTDKLGASSKRSGREIDALSGRLRLIADAAVVLGPALIPIGAVAVPAVTGLAMAFGAAAGAAGVAVLAFNGVGDALKSLNTYQAAPTQQNLEAMRLEFDKIGPAGEHLVRYLDSLGPALAGLQNTARGGLFPGVEAGIESLMQSLPQMQVLVFDIATRLGALASETGAGLSGDGFKSFFEYLRTDAGPTLTQLGHSIGNVAEGMANLFVGLAPLTRDFTGGMESMTASFATWAAGVSKTQGFEDFLSYVEQSGPQVLHLIGAMSSAFVGIIRAAAPVGEVVVPALAGLAEILGAIADSPIGPPLYSALAAMVAFNRISSLTTATLGKFGIEAEKTSAAMGKIKGAATVAGSVLAGMAIVDSLQRQFEGLNTGIEGVTGQLLNLSSAGSGAKMSGEFSDLADSFDRLADPNMAQALQDNIYDTLGFLGSDSRVDKAKAQLDAVDSALTNIAATRGVGPAKEAFAALAESMGLSADEQATLLGMLPQYQDALAGAANAAGKGADAERDLAAATGTSTRATQKEINTMRAKRAAILGAFDAETQYRQALKDATAQAGKNEAGIRGSSKAALANRGALSQLAASWNNQSNAVKNNIGRYSEARSSFIKTATAMGVPRKAAIELANKMMEIPKAVVSKVTVATATAMAALAQARAELNSFDGSRYTAIMELHTVRTGAGGQGGGYDGAAGGTTVPKTGRPYADRHPYLLADGEEVISNRYGQADRHRALLKQINANRLAGGGTAAAYTAQVQAQRHGGGSGQAIDYDRLAAALSNLRLTGTLDTAWGPADVEAIASGAARHEVSGYRSLDAARAGTVYTGVGSD